MPRQYAQALRTEAFKEWIKYDGWVKSSLLSWSKKENEDREEQQRVKGQNDSYHRSKIPRELAAVYVCMSMDMHVCRVFMNNTICFHLLFC